MKKENKSGNNAPEHSINKQESIPVEKDSIITNDDYNADLKERLEKKRNCKIIKYDDLPIRAELFAKWLCNIARYGNVDSLFLIFKYQDESNRFGCYFFTDTYEYHISACLPNYDSNYNGYFGCIVSTRKSRVGETWNRGSDLPDGKYTKETLEKIEKGIIRHELKTLQLWRK